MNELKRNANKVYRECIEIMANIGIPLVDLETQLDFTDRTTNFGSCRYNRKTETATITISEHILKCETLKNTILHELAHASEWALGNGHGKEWQGVAKLIEIHTGEKIERTGESEQLDKAYRDRAKYKIVCKECGQTFYRQRKSRLITQTARYSCGECGGKFSVINI